MAEKGPLSPTVKPIRKPATQVKVKEPSQKNPSKQNPSTATPPLEPRVVIVLVVPVDLLEDQVPLYPPNQPNHLPDNPPKPSTYSTKPPTKSTT